MLVSDLYYLGQIRLLYAHLPGCCGSVELNVMDGVVVVLTGAVFALFNVTQVTVCLLCLRNDIKIETLVSKK